MHRLLIATGKVPPPKEVIGSRRAIDQARTFELGQRVEVARFRNRIGKGDVATTKIGQGFDATIPADEYAARIARRTEVNLGQERHRPDLGFGQNEGQCPHK